MADSGIVYTYTYYLAVNLTVICSQQPFHIPRNEMPADRLSAGSWHFASGSWCKKKKKITKILLKKKTEF